MSCDNCNKAKPILSCTNDLIVGTIAALPATALYVYIRNNTTDRLNRYAVTSAAITGLVTVTIDSQQHTPGHNYEIWITRATATNIDARETFTVGGESITCLSVEFERVLDDEEDNVSGNQTIALED